MIFIYDYTSDEINNLDDIIAKVSKLHINNTSLPLLQLPNHVPSYDNEINARCNIYYDYTYNNVYIASNCLFIAFTPIPGKYSNTAKATALRSFINLTLVVNYYKLVKPIVANHYKLLTTTLLQMLHYQQNYLYQSIDNYTKALASYVMQKRMIFPPNQFNSYISNNTYHKQLKVHGLIILYIIHHDQIEQQHIDILLNETSPIKNEQIYHIGKNNLKQLETDTVLGPEEHPAYINHEEEKNEEEKKKSSKETKQQQEQIQKKFEE